ncbi:hypothetical protein [Saccharopolyspora phatthalungensis]|uniref:Uncharacterized protein n=1 Tax=Saccharopolyspora phatthalungensis TaxID=664693 RepID=A0A840QD88_9PSEU|nr:hypothetical protein [Saccharopolyspora phatthalungensis]MBB5157957.1 hypothetical protein [Saccharopolyspora phatthalungensis]
MTTTGRRPNLDVDLLDTRNCNVRLACECCQSRSELAASACHTPLGVLCVTLCGTCSRAGKRPHWSGPRGADRIGEHCLHLGIDRATMSALLAQQQDLDVPEVWFY